MRIDKLKVCLPLFLLFLLCLLLIIPASAETECFSNEVVDAEILNYTQGSSVENAATLHSLIFNNPSYFTGNNLISFDLVANEDCYNYTGVLPASGGTTFTSAFGTGQIEYYRISGNIKVRYYFNSFISDLSVPTVLTVNFTDSEIFNLSIQTVNDWHYTIDGEFTDESYNIALNGFGTNGVYSLRGAAGGNYPVTYEVVYSQSFENCYTYVDADLNLISVNKGVSASKWIIQYLGEDLINESVVNAENFSLNTTHAPITLFCVDLYDNEYADTIFSPVYSGDFIISGFVFNAKEGYPVNAASLYIDGSLYLTTNSTGLYGFTIDAGVYNLTVSASGYETLIYNLTVNNHKSLNIPLVPTYDDSGLINEAVIYGVVLEKTTGVPIVSVRLTADNGTEFSTFSNSLGYYEFAGLVVDVYGITAEKEGYYNTFVSVNITVLNTSTYQLIEMVNPSLIITPTPTPATEIGERTKERVYSLFAGFGLSENSTNYILALLIILACAAIMAGFVPKAALGGATLGALIGILVSAGMGLIPMWFIVLFIFIGSLIYAYKFFGEG